MRKLPARESLLLGLPVLLIAAVALLKASGHLTLSNPFDLGPYRLEVGVFQSRKVTPLEVAHGYDWTARATLQMPHPWNAPSGWKQLGDFMSVNDMRLVYRRGKVWKKATITHPGLLPVKVGVGSSEIVIWADLAQVPKDADEVRVRGWFKRRWVYNNPLPQGWKPPQDLELEGANKLALRTRPIDVLIKASGQPIPSPIVSRVSPIQFVKPYYQLNPWGAEVYLQFHRLPQFGLPVENMPLAIHSFVLRDNSGKQVNLCDNGGKGTAYTPGSFHILIASQLSAKIPPTDFLAAFLDGGSPRGGWDKKKSPYSLELEISEADNWPIHFKVPIRFDRQLENQNFPGRWK